MDHLLSQANMGKFLEYVGVLRPLQYAVQMDVDRSPLDLAFLISRWSSYSHTFVTTWGEFCPSLEDVFMLMGLPTFGDYHTVDALDNKGERLLALLHETMNKAKYASSKGTYFSWLSYFIKGQD